MNNEERLTMVTREIAYDLVNLTGDNTYEPPLSSDSAEVRQHGLMVSKERIESLPVNLQDAIRFYSALLRDINQEPADAEETRELLQQALIIFVTHMLRTGALKLGNV